MRQYLCRAIGVGIQPLMGNQILLDDHRHQRCEQKCVGPRAHPQMDIGQLGGFGASRVDDDQAARRIARDLAQRQSCAWDAMRYPRILADEQGNLAVRKVTARIASEHSIGDPELAGLFLRQRAGSKPRSEHRAGGAAVSARQMIALPAAAVVEDRFAAVRIADRGETCRDFTDRGIPVNFFEGSVGATSQRLGQAVRVVLVEIQARGLFAGVTLGARMRIVAADAHKPSSIITAQLNLDAAVALAKDAGGGFPFGYVGGGGLHVGIRRRCESTCKQLSGMAACRQSEFCPPG